MLCPGGVYARANAARMFASRTAIFDSMVYGSVLSTYLVVLRAEKGIGTRGVFEGRFNAAPSRPLFLPDSGDEHEHLEEHPDSSPATPQIGTLPLLFHLPALAPHARHLQT
ncbi:hypothetical protein FRC08_018130 [Ceratobasidium sp. 394]|nr:hypothetical protein FRC08_018130 [Ceratobasidium sp. 394]